MTVINLKKSNQLISEMIDSQATFFLGRLGSVEAGLLHHASRNKNYPLSMRKLAWINAGIWPPTRNNLDYFVQTYTEAVSQADAIAVWPIDVLKVESQILENHNRSASRIGMTALDPVTLSSLGNTQEVWSVRLENKRILVIHPMKKTIEKQFKNRSQLHKFDILPEFDLKVLSPPQTQGLTFWKKNYRKQLADQKNRLDDIFSKWKPDLVLVAAGGYGMPIAAHCKTSDISAIYMGGALQLLFGILGKRWSERPEIKKIQTPNWVGTELEKKPFGYSLVERGTYWS